MDQIKINSLTPQIRYLDDMRDLFYDQKWAQDAPNLELYYMYRDLAKTQEDKERIIQNSFRYDITVMNPVALGKEFNKTAGHSHPLVPGTNLTYPELYQVLKGKVIFLLQKTEKDTVKELYAIKAKKGDKIIIPPGFDHIIINLSAKKIKTANWIYRDFGPNLYQAIKKKGGFCYFALKNKEKKSKIEWVKNKQYHNVPKIKFIKPNQQLSQFKISQDEPIYQLVNNLDRLRFLKIPQNYNWDLK